MRAQMARAISLHVGVDDLEGAVDEACAATDRAWDLGYETTTLIAWRACAGPVVDAIRDAALRLEAGGAFLLTLAARREADRDGRGGWRLHDRVITDDELDDLRSWFRPGVTVAIAEPAPMPLG